MNGWEEKPNGWEEYNTIKTKPNITIKCPVYHKNLDGIFVLAGGINKKGECHEWVKRRLQLAYLIHTETDKPIYCLGGGSYHIEPILNKKNYVIHESTACAEYLIQLGVNSSKIYKEWSSYDTIANAFFGFTNFIIPLKLKNIIVITSDFHLPRTKVIFLWIKKIFNSNINIHFLSVTDENIDDSIILNRIEREKNSLNSIQTHVIDKIQLIEQFHIWFYTQHKAYCANSEIIRTNELNDTEKKSY